MRDWHYIRDFSRIESGAGLPCHELLRELGISYTTLRRLRQGRPVTLATLRSIEGGLRKLKYERPIRVEVPDHVLKLALAENHVRFNRIEHMDPSSLITVEVLAQLLEGRAFTKTFAKTLRAFLQSIVVEKNEYSIQKIGVDHRKGFVAEWQHKVSDLVEGDQMRDLYIFLRNNFRTLIDRSVLLEAKRAAIKKSGSVEVVELTIPIANMTALSSAEQNLLITFGQACNELAVLVRLAVFGAHHHRKGRMYDAFAVSQQMTIMKLLAGKIHECWKLIRVRYFGTGLSKKYHSIILAETKADLRELQRYFKSGSNIIARIRNEAAFHYSNADVRDAFNYITDRRECLVYMAQKRFFGMSCIFMPK